MTPMKRMSCKGCEQCGYLIGDLRDQMWENGLSPIVDTLEDKALYKLVVDNVSYDRESGIVDDWDIVFEKVKDEE